MATQVSFSSSIVLHQFPSLKKSVFGLAMRSQTRLPVNKAVKLQIRCSVRNQVFEDHATGIICYKDDTGEIICEGFDEGPRLLQPHPRTPYPLRDADILDSLQKRWLQIMNGETTNENALVEERFNGLNALH
ncbi:hypothetical protein RND81_05G240900 [Saponaria officinalis]|uniref:Uncharacterized protein n=1 Tax=Saponaria officinalis TaxID=3572 RepID=A0AAW1L208_SAPOF